MRRVKAGPRQRVGRLMTVLCGFQRSHGQQLMKRLTPAEAQIFGEVKRHHGRLGVTPKGLENSENEDVTGLKLNLLQGKVAHLFVVA